MTVATMEKLITAEQRALVQQTWQQVVPIADTAARVFYNRLFEIDPQLRVMFDGVEMKSQRRKLIQVLAMAVGRLDRIEELVPVIEALGRRHAAYGVSDAHYETVGAALIWTLEKGLGKAWSEEVKAAWTEVYVLLANVMRTAAAESMTSRTAAQASASKCSHL
jgi:hemoglobin-like flavoprotein